MCKIMEWWETRRQTFVDKGIGRGAGNGGGEEIEIEQDVLLYQFSKMNITIL